MEKKVTWNDLHEGSPKELMEKYKLDERGLQQHLNRHLDGATHAERQSMYKATYDNKGRK